MKYSSLILIIIFLLTGVEIRSQDIQKADNKFKITYQENEIIGADGSETIERRIIFMDTTITLSGFMPYNISANGEYAGIRIFDPNQESDIYIYNSKGTLVKEHSVTANTPKGIWIFNNGYYAIYGNRSGDLHLIDTFSFCLFDNEGSLIFRNSKKWSFATEIINPPPGNTAIIVAPIFGSIPYREQLVLFQNLDQQPIILSKVYESYQNPRSRFLTNIDSDNKQISIYYYLKPNQILDSILFNYSTTTINDY